MSVAGKGYMYVFRAMDGEMPAARGRSTRSASGHSQVIGFVPTLRISECRRAHKESRYPREILLLFYFFFNFNFNVIIVIVIIWGYLEMIDWADT